MYRPTHISASAPTVNDDYSEGFRQGNFWRTSSSLYILEDEAEGAADWQSALSGENLGEWASWTPTYSWTGSTPANITTVARYCVIGKTVYIILQVGGTGGISDTTDMSCTLPHTPAETSNKVPLLHYAVIDGSTTREMYAVIDSTSDPKRLNHICFTTIGTEIIFRLYYAGFYEMA